MSEIENKCVVCKSTDFDQISYLYSHKNTRDELHIMCKECILASVKVCTCNKKFIEEEPTKISVKCPVCPPEESTKFFNITHGENFRELLRKYADDYYIIDGCRGCLFNTEQIQTEFKYAKQAAIEACVYKLTVPEDQEVGENDNDHLTGYIYVSDALDNDFIERAKLLGANLGDEMDLVAQ